MNKVWPILFLFMGFSSLADEVEVDLIIEDFEKKRGNWTFEGSAFEGYGHGDYWHPGRFDRGMLRTRGHRGTALLKSWGRDGRNVDGVTGRALSPPFKLERNFIRFMMSGGKNPGKISVNLLVDGKVVRSASGNNSNQLEAVAFEISPFKEKEAQVEVIDQSTDPWGHVCIDDLVQTNDSAGARIANDKKAPTPDVVWLQTGRQEGDLNWRAGKLHLSEKPIRWEDIRSISRQSQVTRSSPRQAVQFLNGETWQVEILTMTKGKLTLKGEVYGQRTVELSSVRSLEFSPSSELAVKSRPGILYRSSGRPVPGKLIWIKKEDVAIDCPLGIVPLPRQGLVRYILPGENAGEIVGTEWRDEIGLRDGSILKGQVRIEGEQVVLEHPTLETISVPWGNLRYLIRSGEETYWLTDLDDAVVKSFGPLGAGIGAEYLDLRRTPTSSLSVVRVTPQTVVRYKLGSSANKSDRRLRAKLAMIPGSLGDAMLSFSVEGKEFFRKALSSQDDAVELNLPLPAGNELAVKVDFGERLAYPCGVELHDAHLVGHNLQRGATKP